MPLIHGLMAVVLPWNWAYKNPGMSYQDFFVFLRFKNERVERSPEWD